MVLEYNAMQTGLSMAPLSLTMFGVALLAGKKAGAHRPSSIIRLGFALLAVWPWEHSSRSCLAATRAGTSWCR